MNRNGTGRLREPAVLRSAAPIKVLAYHRIVRDDRIDPAYRMFATNIEVFRNQVRALERSGFTTITFEDYHLHLRGELNLPKKPVIISFDDGYRDTHEVAFPVLREFGMRAVVFVLGDETIRTNYWDHSDGYPAAPLMAREHIVEMHEAGFEIGSHSLTHPRLTTLTREQAWEEISRSRMLLEILINAPVRAFCYPYGLLNDTVKGLVREAGYAFGCGVYTGPPRFGADLYDIRRIHPSSLNSSIPFLAQVSLPYERVAWMRWRVKNFLIGDESGR